MSGCENVDACAFHVKGLVVMEQSDQTKPDPLFPQGR